MRLPPEKKERQLEIYSVGEAQMKSMSRRFLARKFILPMVAIILGAVMVLLDDLDGSAWAAMATTLITGFYAVTGWATNHHEVKREQVLSSAE